MRNKVYGVKIIVDNLAQHPQEVLHPIMPAEGGVSGERLEDAVHHALRLKGGIKCPAGANNLLGGSQGGDLAGGPVGDSQLLGP